MTTRFHYVVVTCSTCLLVFLVLGTVLGRTSAAEGDAYRHFEVFTEVISKIKAEYVEEPNMQNVALGALNGLLESIDPYASYLSADQYKQYLRAKEAPKPNVGLLLSRRFGYVGVIDSVPGSPADVLGLTTGDVVEAINGVSTRDMPLAYAELLLQGDPGSTIELSVIRVRRSAEAQKIQLTRQKIAMPVVTGKMVSGDVAYVQAASLETGKTKQIAAEITKLQGQGAKKLVLDLRNNAGGEPEQGIALANLFLDKGVIAYTKGQKSAKEDVTAQGPATWKGPLVVMTNRGTAGGAEIAASGLLDNKRAELVGERTYGDAAVRKALTMEDGSAVILAVAKYYNAAGKAIQDNAVTPSLVVADPNDNSADDDGPAANPQAPPKPAEDVQLKKAIEVVSVGLQAAKQSDPKVAAQSDAAQKSSPDSTKPSPTSLGVPRQPK